MNLTGAQEAQIRTDLKTYFDTLGVCGHVFTRRRLITSRADFARALGVRSIDKETEIQFLEIEFLKFTDSTTEGFDDCPAVEITYGLHVFKEFKDLRSDGSNSDLDFVGCILAMRNGILNNRAFGSAVANPIEQLEFAQFGNDNLTDCKGYSVDLILKVDYYLGS